MSQLSTPVRVARPAIAAVERARLALVPVRRVDAPRAPFAALVLLILGAGVVGLLMFNTQMQQDSFYATRLQHHADRLTAQRESLQLELDDLRDPQRLSQAAAQLGMVQAPNPAFVDLVTGRIVGQPVASTRADRPPMNARLVLPKKDFEPPAKVVLVPPKAPAKKPTKNGTADGDGPASPAAGAPTGTNGAGTAAQGATR